VIWANRVIRATRAIWESRDRMEHLETKGIQEFKETQEPKAHKAGRELQVPFVYQHQAPLPGTATTRKDYGTKTRG